MASILEGLFAGRAGVQSHGVALSIISDNVANANTTGFKSSRADFVDVLAGNIGGQNSSNITGSGSFVTASTTIFTQGSIEKTGRDLDVAIDGDGFFILKNEFGAVYYSRAGNFKIGPDGFVRNQTDLLVQGFSMTGAGGLGPLSINTVSSYTSPTTRATISGNLNASAHATGDPFSYTSWADLNTNASLNTFVDVYDSLGAVHTVNIMFFRQQNASGDITWVANAYIDGSEIRSTAVDLNGNPAVTGQPFLVATNVTLPWDPVNFTMPQGLSFNSNGQRDPITFPDLTTNMDWANGASSSNVQINFDPMTQFSSPSYINSIVQDGFRSGTVDSLSIGEDGTLIALLNNGQKVGIGKIALAVFSNIEGLDRVGDSRFVQTFESGQAVVGTPNTGKFGRLIAQSLELSTTDLSNEFVKLIIIQRGFQGCTRIIGKMDELLANIIQMVN